MHLLNRLPFWIVTMSVFVWGVSLTPTCPAQGTDASDRKVLFSGKDLAGWRSPTGDWQLARSVSLAPSDNKKFFGL